MSGIDVTTAGMDDPPLARSPRVPSVMQHGAAGWRGPQITDRAMIALPALRQRHFATAAQLETERSTWFQHWREIAEYILPERGRFFTTDVNRGIKRQQKIRDSKATRCLRTLDAGMMTGMTSPARPWFQYAAADDQAGSDPRFKRCLDQATNIVRALLSGSNLYNILPTVYQDLGGFGTSAMAMVDDPVAVFRFAVFPIGSYSLSTNHDGTVDEFVRKARFTARQLVERFGAENVSPRTRDLYQDGNAAIVIEAWWYVGPNPNWDGKRIGAQHKRYISAWWEIGANGKDPAEGGGGGTGCLSLSGFDVFPILCPRWEVTGEDVYGTSPGMLMLPDVKELMTWIRKRARARDKVIDPAMQVPGRLRMQGVGLDAGDETVVDNANDVIRPVHDLHFDFVEARLAIGELKQSISECSFESLFLAITQDDREQPATAREIQERHEEKLTALGPVLNQVNTDLLKPLIERAFTMAAQAGKFSHLAWPEAMRGQAVKVQFVSILQAAQRLTEVVAIEKTADFAIRLANAAGDASALDPLTLPAMVATYADLTGAPTTIMATAEEQQAKAAARAEAARRQQQQAQAAQAAKTAHTLADTPGGENILANLGQTIGGEPPGAGWS